MDTVTTDIAADSLGLKKAAGAMVDEPGGTAAIDAKRRRSFGEQWMQFAAVTSNVPFAAIVAGKNRLGPAVVEIGVWRPLVAIVVYAVAFYLHGRVGLLLT